MRTYKAVAFVIRATVLAALVMPLTGAAAFAQTPSVAGTLRSEAGHPLPGALVELEADGPVRRTIRTTTSSEGNYRFDRVAPGRHTLIFTLVNFAPARHPVVLSSAETTRVDVVLQLALNADVTVTEKATFVNLADAQNPTQNLVGIALAASQGAITARQLGSRPIMRAGEVLETVPGVVISQHMARVRRISTICEASIWITGPISRRRSPACR